ncbi:ABC transporter permease [Curtobacterium sp. MCBD17_035]|uniref:ABC transporter permease n=1 Tax=Curtobacterium sp. MCBD17_035 TaxID=2175673 RepID=UPI000DA9B9B6|nr:ABC transporter permease [Curtobacterium sp. MCBD17_035]WIB68980.1 ABC transporter permease [Curtobacterium sp. MCBD17_035]
MIRFLLRRLGSLVAVLLVLSAVVFLLQQISPGDPARAALGANASRQAVDAERHRLGLDDPLPVQFLRFIAGALHGDFGTSYRTHRAVATDLASAFPATVELVLAAFVIALVLAGLFAASAALRWPFAGVYRGALLLAATAPPFLLALGGIILFYAQLDWLPASGQGTGGVGSAVSHLVLPATVLAIAPALAIGRILRAGLETTLVADHVRTARSKGLGEGAVLARHVVRNAIGPALAMAGLQLGFMFAGDVVVEQVFSWPGMGNYLANSIPTSDYPAIAAVTLVLGAVYVVVNTVADVLQTAADPRLA